METNTSDGGIFVTQKRKQILIWVFCGSENDPAAGSPTATLLRLLLPLAEKYCLDSERHNRKPESDNLPQALSHSQSVATTGGVYKWQGHNRSVLMKRDYETFLVQEE